MHCVVIRTERKNGLRHPRVHGGGNLKDKRLSVQRRVMFCLGPKKRIRTMKTIDKEQVGSIDTLCPTGSV